MGLGLGVPAIFPSFGSVFRHPPSLHRVPRVGSPVSPVLCRCSDSPQVFPPCSVAVAQWYRPCAPYFAPLGTERLPEGQGIDIPVPFTRVFRTESKGPPRFLVNPLNMPWSQTPAERPHQAHTVLSCCLPLLRQRRPPQ